MSSPSGTGLSPTRRGKIFFSDRSRLAIRIDQVGPVVRFGPQTMNDALDNPYIALNGSVDTMPVKVLLHSRIRDVAGLTEIEMDPAPSTVGDLVLELAKRFGPRFSQQVFKENGSTLRDNVVILVNGHSIKMLQGMETPVAVGDKVTADTLDILQAVGGG